MLCFFYSVVLVVLMFPGFGVCESGKEQKHPSWLVHVPKSFEHPNYDSDTKQRKSFMQEMKNVSGNSTVMVQHEALVAEVLLPLDGYTDGEVVDLYEHYFYGLEGGTSMELGALDGSTDTRSMTVALEKLGWKRILVDGNPRYRENMKAKSPNAFSALAAICPISDSEESELESASAQKEKQQQLVHYAPQEYTGGILEFMAVDFLRDYHKVIYEAGTPKGNVSTVSWDSAEVTALGILPVDCIPLSSVLRKAKSRHVNFFILDVEGGEMQVLKTINWGHTIFDVLCIETEKQNRPPHFLEDVTAYLKEQGYHLDQNQGRNSWFTRVDFIPSSRPGIAKDCFNGFRKCEREDKWWTDRKTPPFSLCPLVI